MRARVRLAILISGVVLAGCGGAVTSYGTNQAPVQAPGQRAGGAGSAADGSGLNAAPVPALGAAPKAQAPANGGAAKAVSPLGATPPKQSIERSVAASYTVAHGHFLASFNSVLAESSTLNGYVVSSTTAPDDTGAIVSGTLTVKIPADKLASFLAGLPGDFQTSSINFSSVDHTSEFVDVNAQLKAVTTHHDVLIKLLAGATSLTDITTLDDQIATVEQQINTLQGQLDQLNGEVDYSTASISISERGTTVVTPPPPSSFKPLGDAVGTGLANARDVVAALLTGLLSLLPLLVLLGLIVLMARLGWLPRARRAAAAPTAPAQPPTEVK